MITAEHGEKMAALVSSGYAGVLSDGKIVDRREYPNAIPIQANTMFNVPKPKRVEKV